MNNSENSNNNYEPDFKNFTYNQNIYNGQKKENYSESNNILHENADCNTEKNCNIENHNSYQQQDGHNFSGNVYNQPYQNNYNEYWQNNNGQYNTYWNNYNNQQFYNLNKSRKKRHKVFGIISFISALYCMLFELVFTFSMLSQMYADSQYVLIFIFSPFIHGIFVWIPAVIALIFGLAAGSKECRPKTAELGIKFLLVTFVIIISSFVLGLLIIS